MSLLIFFLLVALFVQFSSPSATIEPGLYKRADYTFEIRIDTPHNGALHPNNITILWAGKPVRAKVHVEGKQIKKIGLNVPKYGKKQITGVDNTTLLEMNQDASGDGSAVLWDLVIPPPLPAAAHGPVSSIWEVGVIVDLHNPTKVSRSDRYIKSAFAGAAPVHYWHALHRPGDCPTSNVSARANEKHPAEAIISTTLSHSFVWVEARRRLANATAAATAASVPGAAYLLVLEDDAVCAARDCAAATDRALAQAGGKVWHMGVDRWPAWKPCMHPLTCRRTPPPRRTLCTWATAGRPRQARPLCARTRTPSVAPHCPRSSPMCTRAPQRLWTSSCNGWSRPACSRTASST